MEEEGQTLNFIYTDAPVLNVFSWSFRGKDGSLKYWGWCYYIYICIPNKCWKFNLILTSVTSSRLPCPWSVHPGVLEDSLVLETTGEMLLSSQQLYIEHMSKVSFDSDMNNPVKTPPVLQVYLWRLGWRGNLDILYGMWGVIYKYTLWPAFIGGVFRSFGASSDVLLYFQISIFRLQKIACS